MERYRYDEKELRFIEESCVPFAVYQYINKRVVTIALSQGFCDLLGYSRQEAVDLMDNNMYRDTHPEDVTYVNDAATRFINEGGEYNTIYRSLKDGEYRIVHAYGRHITKEDGTRLAIIWYNDEGPFSDTSEGRTSQFNQSLSKAIGERNLYKKSNFDYATGLPGMSYFFDLAEQGRRVLLTLGEKVAILYIDLSGMKEFNMQYGFAEGDLLIRSFAKALVKQFTNTNCSHFSADHFAVYTKADGLEKKLDALFADCMTLNAGRNLTVRVGVYIDELGTVPISAACDRAKIASDTGKDVRSSQAYYFDYSMVEQLEKQQYVRDHIDKAIEENWIEVYFQPIVRAANDKVCEEECLVRWNDPENGFMSPADFIPILKEQNTIYKLDLHVVELALEKLKDLSGKGYPMVPQSINLAKEDFYACDMVEEIKKRVDAAGIEREYLTIEIAEDTISGDMDFMQKQVERFREQGFSVWLDDYGSGNASPTVLQKIHFDLVKFDITFIHQIEDKDTSGKIVLAELVKMLMALHMDTVAEGVETEEQVEFLKEIGCTKLQGRYYANAIPLEEIYERNRKGIQIGFENPAEVDYYEAMGRVNLYDFAMTKNDDASLKNYFDTMPMVIYEVGEESLRVVRANKSYRDFVGRAFRRVAGKTEFVFDEYKEGAWGNALKAVRHCAKDGKRAILEERTLNGDVIQLFIRRIAVNPVSGVAAVTAIVLSYMDKKTATSSLTYTHVARALSEDYIYLYYVDMDNNSFVEYGSDNDFGDLPLERLGDNFFEYALEKANADVIDMDNFREVFTKENIQKNIENNGAFNLTYQLMLNGVPTYVNLKALPIKTTGNHIIIGVNNVDAQMRQREAYERIKEERITFNRITALSGDSISMYVVDPETDEFTEFITKDEYTALGFEKKGDDFFATTAKNSQLSIYAEDLKQFEEMVTKENILKHIKESGTFSLTYRLMIGGQPTYVNLKAAMVEEKDGPKLIVGISNIDAQVKRDQEYAHNLSAARDKANLDELTGVKNKHAYVDMEMRLNDMIEEGAASDFAIVVCDLNGLKYVNDTFGHQAGDKFIKNGCTIICKTFAHSPVYRVGGDEFVAIVQGADYENVEELMEKLGDINRKNRANGEVVIAAGMARFSSHDKRVSAVFDRADGRMYENKKMLKGIKD